MKSEREIDPLAPDGKLWVCMACGRIAKHLYISRYATEGWGEGCEENAELHDRKDLEIDERGYVTNLCWSDFKKTNKGDSYD